MDCASYLYKLVGTLYLFKFAFRKSGIAVFGNDPSKSEYVPDLYHLVGLYHKYKIDSYYHMRQYWATSNIGTFMFKNNKHETFGKRNKTFLILYWKFWGWQRSRHPGDVFAQCSVKNCKLTTSNWDITKADAVVVNIQRGLLPFKYKRPRHQRWIFMTDESPVNAFVGAWPKPNLKDWANVFNWTMTYRSDSDVPIPYGRTLPLTNPLSASEISDSIKNLIPNWKIKQRDVYMTALISHCCVPERMNYIKELQNYLKVDIYGACSPDHKNSCPGHTSRDCPVINKYLFYLAFENSKCRQYISEKTFYNAYTKGSIPIIMGAPKLDCEKLLPPHSFLHVEDFRNPKDLATNLIRITMNEDKLLMFHQWRRFFKVINEHGFFRTNSFHVCRVCEALNYNDDKPKVYNEDDLRVFVDRELLCEKPFSVYQKCF